jgi:hypothetical protein
LLERADASALAVRRDGKIEPIGELEEVRA